MSGSIHNKGVMIISGFLREKFATKNPFSLTASIAFEQSYGGVDGDSASCAEIYVILSSISGMPIRQSLAITGSVNQKGDVQPIGGVNDKIRGFYEVCKYKGLSGEQGVIIPAQNVKDLMLPDEIINDVKAGHFKIFSISRIEDGVPLLMGLQAGVQDDNGDYPMDTLFGKVTARLEEFRKAAEEKNNNNKAKEKKKKVKKEERKVVDE